MRTGPVDAHVAAGRDHFPLGRRRSAAPAGEEDIASARTRPTVLEEEVRPSHPACSRRRHGRDQHTLTLAWKGAAACALSPPPPGGRPPTPVHQAQSARKRLTEVEAQLRTTRAELEELRAEVQWWWCRWRRGGHAAADVGAAGASREAVDGRLD